MREEDLAARVVERLTGDGWTCYQEVSLGYASKRLDIVAVIDHPDPDHAGERFVWIVETKRAMCFSVFEQAVESIGWAHRISVATASRLSGFARVALESRGIGAFRVLGNGAVWSELDPKTKADPWRVGVLLSLLRPEHLTFAPAGNADGAFWTEWRETCRNLAEAVKAEPGLPLALVVGRIKHHYGSTRAARKALADQLRRGVIDGVTARREGKSLLLFPAGEVF